MNIGLIAHDSKKELMENFCIAYKNILKKHNLFATGTTGKHIIDQTGLDVSCFLPGHLGGDSQLCAQVECNQMDAVIYLKDPYERLLGETDFTKLVQLCDAMNIPIATNLATAEILIIAIDRGDLDWRNLYK